MKIDEIIIKLCSERGYDPSQVNDYPTLLEQLECIKELLKTYPNQQYYTVKAYTFNASTKEFSFKISDVNNYGRQINVGDILIVTLVNNILEIAQISSLDVEAGNGIADDVGQLTGSKGDIGVQGPKGDTGAQGPKGDAGLSQLVWEGGVFYTRNNVALGATINMGPISSFNRTPVAGDTYNVLVTQQNENDTEIASYFCQLKFTQAVGGAFMSEITNLTKATGTDGTNGLPALTFSGIMNVQTIPQVGNTFSYAPAFASNFNRTPVVGDVLNVLVNHKSNSDSYMCTIKVTGYTSPTLTGTYVNVTKATGTTVKPTMYMAVAHTTVYADVNKTNSIGIICFNIPYTNNNLNIGDYINNVGSDSYVICSGYVTIDNVKYSILYTDNYNSETGEIFVYTLHDAEGGINYYIGSINPAYIPLN